MTHEELYEQLCIELEHELLERTDELSKIENFFDMYANSSSDVLSGIMRKSLILLLYAHFEGYCKQAFQFYIVYINRKQLPLNCVKHGIIAANLNAEFQKLFDTNHKPISITTLSNDGSIQLHGRKRNFLIECENITARMTNLDESIINTEANLKPDVLRKILFQLELDCSIIDAYQGEIHRLVNIRNSYAHGERSRYPSQSEYNDYKLAALTTMNNIKNIVEKAFYEQAYLKAV